MSLICRQKLRSLEGAVIEYRESLEESGLKNPDEIERKVKSHRSKLLLEYGLLDGLEYDKRKPRSERQQSSHSSGKL